MELLAQILETLNVTALNVRLLGCVCAIRAWFVERSHLLCVRGAITLTIFH